MKNVLLAIIMLVVFTAPAHAYWRHGGGGYEHGGYEHRGYHEGAYIGGALVAGLALGAFITSLPPRHDVVYVDRTPYYYDGAYYYQQRDSGYVVVAPVVAQPSNVSINIPNTNGSYTVVLLVHKDNGYVGPQGEFYASMPTVEQLRLMYAK